MQLFNLFRRPARPAPSRRARLTLEALHDRLCPDGGMGDITPGDRANATPLIVDFEFARLASGMFDISGTVIDENPGGLTVYFDAEQEAIDGKTVITQVDGSFSLTVTLMTDGSDDGMVSAWTYDAAGQKSNVVYLNLIPR